MTQFQTRHISTQGEGQDSLILPDQTFDLLKPGRVFTFPTQHRGIAFDTCSVHTWVEAGSSFNSGVITVERGNQSSGENFVALSTAKTITAPGFTTLAGNWWEAAYVSLRVSTAASSSTICRVAVHLRRLLRRTERLIYGAEQSPRILISPLETTANFLNIDATAYFLYMGRLGLAHTPKYVAANLTVNGASTQTAEVGLFSTPGPPAKSALTMTAITTSGSLDDLTTGAVKVIRNSSAFTTEIPAGTHLWAALRTSMASTEPSFRGVASDFGQGQLQTLVGAGALTGSATFAPSIPAVISGAQGPVLRVEMD